VPTIRSLLADPASAAELEAVLASDLDEPASPHARDAVQLLTTAFGDALVALIHYGSHAQSSDARPESAFDFFVVVERYAEAYRSLAAHHGTSYHPATAALLNRVLPPNVIAVRADARTPPLLTKCAVLSLTDLSRACSARARDHFVQGRLFQHVQLCWTRDPESRQAVVRAVVEARARTYEWGRPYLPPRFDAEGYCRTLLETSYAAEIRPESGARIGVMLDAQRALTRLYDDFLQRLAEQRILVREGKVYGLTSPAGRWEKFRVASYFRVSKWRATARWLKYVVLYDDWLDYILRKVARRSGVSVQLTERERRWPLIFLWPKLLRYLRSRPQRDG
jgi:hypothetical protein